MLKDIISSVTRSPLSLLGVVLATIAGVMFLTLFSIEQLGYHGGPYIGILAFVGVPAIFVIGLVLIPLGTWRLRRADRRSAESGQPPTRAPVIDFNNPRTRVTAVWVAGASVVNFAIIASATYKAVEVMESNEFCGAACHSVMNPEYSTYQRSHHSRVKCTECHIGSGADWFVKSKLSGSWQLVSVTFDLYPRPIPTPVENLRPARDTCEQCHFPTRFVGQRLKVFTRYDEDEASTEKKSVLMNKVGGELGGKDRGGVHWHVAQTLRYRSDHTRQHVFEVEHVFPDGGVVRYENHADAGTAVATEEWRVMDCLDCHNRPSHVYQRPEDVIDHALEHRDIDREALPFIKREGLRVLSASYASWDEAKTKIREELVAFYARERPEVVEQHKDALDHAAAVLYEGYTQNVFPQMKIEWNTYPSFKDHFKDEGGCFRCHTSDMKDPSGKKVSAKCDLCHVTVAEAEENPEVLEILSGE